MVSNRTVFSIMFSAMLMDALRAVTLFFQSCTVLMAIYSALEGCKPKLRCRQVLDELGMDENASSDAKMQRAMDQISHHVITMISQWSTKRQRLYTNQHLENHTMKQSSL